MPSRAFLFSYKCEVVDWDDANRRPRLNALAGIFVFLPRSLVTVIGILCLYVSMPSRAFLFSYDCEIARYPLTADEVSMPSRAFLFSYFTSAVIRRRGAADASLNALAGIFVFLRKIRHLVR